MLKSDEISFFYKLGLRRTDVMIDFFRVLGPVRYRRNSRYFISTEY